MSGSDNADPRLMQYGIFFASAGHAALIDYPHASGLQKIATDIWVQGGVVSAVYVSFPVSHPKSLPKLPELLCYPDLNNPTCLIQLSRRGHFPRRY